jgi:DNA mismatch repair protein MutS
MALINEYFDLTNKYKNDYGDKMVLLMMVGSFFEVYGILDKSSGSISGSQIQEFSRICELNVVEKNVCVGVNSVVMAGFKDIMIEKYIKKLQDAGFTAVVYTQDESAKNTTRSLAGIFSPGTYFAEDNSRLSNNTVCIWIDLIRNNQLLKGNYVVVGVANIDIYTGKTAIFQYKEFYIHNPTTYDELERFISIYNPNESIIISNLTEKEINDIIQFTNINSKLIHKISLLNTDSEEQNQFTKRAINCEKQIFQKEVLERFYQITDFSVFIQNFYENNIATQAFCFLLDFIYQHNPHLMNKISEPIFENYSDRLTLANHSLKQLNIIGDDNSNYNGQLSSVLKMLNICLTPMGQRKFNYLILNPKTNSDFLKKEYNMTEYFLGNYEKYSNFLNCRLSKIKDLSKWSRQLYLKKLPPKSFYQLYNNLFVIKEIYDFLKQDQTIINYLSYSENNKNKIPPDISDFCNKMIEFIQTNLNIEMTREMDQTQQFEDNFINRNIDTDLDLKMEDLTDSTDKLEAIRVYLNSIIENSEKKGKSTDFIKIHETEKNNFTLITTNRRCKLLEDALPSNESIIQLKYNSSYSNKEKVFNFMVSKKQFEYHKQTASNNSISDNQISLLCKKINQLKIKMKDLITQVYYKFINDFEKYQGQLENISQFITLIDIIYAKAAIAFKYNYCKPEIDDSAEKSFINVIGLRHCLIEQLLQNELYTANNIDLGLKIDGILLYGTNAVGKTSFIRAIGISVIMAQAGLYVPASKFTFKPYNYIFTRILGNDNLFKGLSTFAVEMSELRTILRLADKNSLILGDELCSGTENSSAISIFVAGIQRLTEMRSSFIFATHLHEIIDYDEIKNLKNISLKHMAVIYDREKDMLIYDRRLQDGPGNSMYGLEVCKSLNLPDDFIRNAYEIRMKYNPIESSLLSLKTSHYNSKKIMSLCEKCGNQLGSEVHHLQHQSISDGNGIITNKDIGSVFHKNNLANLVTLCEDCHQEFHKSGNQHKKVKTTKGYQLNAI